MGSELRVAVVGAGTAGPAAALFLARQGHQVTLFERAGSPSPIGAGITLQPTGLCVLSQLGLLENILAQGSRIDWLDGRTSSGRVVLDLRYQTLHPKLFGLGIHRGALFQELYDALPASGVALRTGCGVISYSEHNNDVLVETSDGTSRFHLLVVADGARSSLRAHHPARTSVRQYQWGALWTVLPAPEGRDFEVLSNTLTQVFKGTSQFVGFLPTGLGPPGSKQTNKPIVSMFWSIETSRMDSFRQRGVAAFRDDVRTLTGSVPRSDGFHDYVEQLLGSIQDSDQLLPAAYFDVTMPFLNTRRVVFLGDAAHAMSPQLGQGANLALYDAWALSEALAESVNDIPSALDSYARQRKSHLTFYQWATRLLTPFFQSNLSVLGLARDLTMGPLCRLPFFSRQGLGAMAGYKCGIFSTVPISYRLSGRVQRT